MKTSNRTLRTACLVACLTWIGCKSAEPDPTVKAQQDIEVIIDAVEAYAQRNGGRYPSAMKELLAQDANGQAYLADATVDPWGNAYRYHPPLRGGTYQVVSFGADGSPGGEGASADLVWGPDGP